MNCIPWEQTWAGWSVRAIGCIGWLGLWVEADTKNCCPLSSLPVFSLNFCYAQWWSRKSLWLSQMSKEMKETEKVSLALQWYKMKQKRLKRKQGLFAQALWILQCRRGIFLFKDHLMCYTFLHHLQYVKVLSTLGKP